MFKKCLVMRQHGLVRPISERGVDLVRINDWWASQDGTANLGNPNLSFTHSWRLALRHCPEKSAVPELR